MITGSTAVEWQLEDALCDYIRNWTANDYFTGKMLKYDPSTPSETDPLAIETNGPPIVHAGMIPRELVSGFYDIEKIPQWPFILVQLTDGFDTVPEGGVATKITAGVWDEDEMCQGYRHAVYLIRKIARGIWFEGDLVNSFSFNPRDRMNWRVLSSNEVTHPYYMAEMTVTWIMRTPYIREESTDSVFNTYPADGTRVQPIIQQVGPGNIGQGWPYADPQL